MSIKTALLAATASIFIMGAAHAGGPSSSPGGTSGGATDSPAGAPTMEGPPSGGGGASVPDSQNRGPANSGAPTAAPQTQGEASPDSGSVGAAGRNGSTRDADSKAQRSAPDEMQGDSSSKDGAADNKASEGSEADHSHTKDAATKGEKGKSAGVDRQQIDKARTYFRQNKPSVKAVERNEISVSIGLALPSSIVLYDAPPDIIVVSGGCPIKYFVWGDDVVLVDSCTREVIDII
jgi:hypothetical protein